MPLVVQKYGGSSVKDVGRVKAVAERVAERHHAGNQMVVVVSAMGDTTDELIDLAQKIAPDPEPREMDMLLSTGELISSALVTMALHALGYKAVALSGPQAGIMTDATFSKAKISAIDPARLKRELDDGKIVIVAGFQGLTDDQDIATLGRGGSDTTAVALAARLKAASCEIYTDVDGIYTADPRIVPEARKLDGISFEEMLEMAQMGARVMHPRAVELGQIYGMPITVRSSYSDREGTVIGVETANKVTGIAHDTDVAKITVVGVPDQPGVAHRLFAPLSAAAINVDTIVQNVGHAGKTDISFTVTKTDLPSTQKFVESVARDLGAETVVANPNMAKVSIVGTGIQNHPGYAARMFGAMSEAGINIEMISTSEIRITVLIDREQVQDAVRALHRSFELDKA
ncbi:MAG TPA: aspartate kinase [Chloroflexota bacterium]|jgi:aspartate kinase|nr:aspartate kinase [Chloroflexota bacterium]